MEIGSHANTVFKKALVNAETDPVKKRAQKEESERLAAEVKKEKEKLCERAKGLVIGLMEFEEMDATPGQSIPHTNWMPVTDNEGDNPDMNLSVRLAPIIQANQLQQVYLDLKMQSVEDKSVEPVVLCYVRFRKNDVNVTGNDGEYSINPGTKEWQMVSEFLNVIEDYVGSL
jgi:hypothetical protein